MFDPTDCVLCFLQLKYAIPTQIVECLHTQRVSRKPIGRFPMQDSEIIILTFFICEIKSKLPQVLIKLVSD